MTLEIPIAEIMLDQGLRELLYAFRKNGGDLNYCVQQIKDDFNKAGWKSPEEVRKGKEAVREAFRFPK